MEEVVILSAVRTPIGRYHGQLSALSAPQLGALVIRETLKRSRLKPAQVDEVIMGQVLAAGVGQAPARQAALKAGLPNSVSALTINKVCGSGLKAVMLAAQAIACGDSQVVVAGGMESMSQSPEELTFKDGLRDAYDDALMGVTAERVAKKYSISRGQQDEYALESYRRALRAQAKGWFKDEILPVKVKGKSVAKDEEPWSAPLEKMGRLKPVFAKAGSVTAGNSSSISDGAAALVLASRSFAEKSGLRPLASIRAYAQGGLDPRWVMLAPGVAVAKLLKKTGLKVADMDLIEINEAFSAAMLALIRTQKLDPARVNVNGGAVALGHPLGASGARILTTLLHALKRRDLKRGLASLCMGGGEGLAMVVER